MAAGRFTVYSSTRGDCFFSEIRHLLACGLGAVEADERGGFLPGADWHVVVAPQQFFYLGAGDRLRTGPWPRGVVLYNTEQTGCAWFPLLRRLLPRAHALWDMDRSTARLLGASWVPLGWVPGCRLFPEGLGPRPIDVAFAGSRVQRREALFRRLPPCRSVIRLVSDSRYLRRGLGLRLARQARIVLNIHRSPKRYFEWHRIALHGIGQGALVISEPLGDARPFKAGRDFVETSLKDMPAAIAHYLSSPEAARIAAQGLRTYRSSGRLSGFLEPAVAELGSPDLGRHARVEAAAALLSLPR